MNTRKELFDYLVSRGIYLNNYFLTLCYEQIKKAGTDNIFKELDDIEADFNIPEFKSEQARLCAAYVIKKSDYHAKISKPVYALDINSGEIVNRYTSAYQACIEIGKPGGFGQVSNCCKGKIKTAYGFKWKFVNQNEI